MKNLILSAIATLCLSSVAQAQSTPNYMGYTDQQIANPYNPVSTSYSVRIEFDELQAFQDAVRSYLLFSRTDSVSRSLSISSLVRIQAGTWWETKIVKRKTIYKLDFIDDDSTPTRHKECSINFSRLESQSSSSKVVPNVGSLVCVNIVDSPF